MSNWSVTTFRAGSRVWRSQIRRNGRIVQEIEYTGTKRAAETDARVTMEALARAES